MKTNVIQLKFINDGVAGEREYTYYANTDVEVGDVVDIDGTKQGIITKVNVPLWEIEMFGNRAKTIIGKAENIKEEDECQITK